MHHFEWPIADTTIYEASQSINAGLDSILEIRKDVNTDGTVVNVSRILIKFDLSFISASVQSGLIPNTAKYYIWLYDANTQALQTTQTLYAYPVSQSWDVGQGRLDSDPNITEGVSWRYRTGAIDAIQWVSESNDIGGTWFSGSAPNYSLEASQSYVYETRDMRMNVSDIVKNWIYSGSTYTNEGFIVKRSGSYSNTDSASEEGNVTSYGHFQFFSSDTNTIFPPKLEVEWDDSVWSTGSLQPLTGSALEDSVFYLKGFRPEYKESSKIRIRVVGRERYPTKTFSTTSANLTVKYLPSGSSYYSIRDAFTEDIIIPFGSGSILSCDSTGNYFNMWLNAFQPERFYRILFNIISGSGTADELNLHYDNDFTFKIIR